MFRFLKPKIPAERVGAELATHVDKFLNGRDSDAEQSISHLVELGADPLMIRIEVGAFLVFSSLMALKCGIPAGKLTKSQADRVANALEREIDTLLKDQALNVVCKQRYGSTVSDLFKRRVSVYSFIVNESQSDAHSIQTTLIETFSGYMVNGSPSSDESIARNFEPNPDDHPVRAGLKFEAIQIYVLNSGAVAAIISGTRIA
jgi:hypothetical protein